MKSCFYAVCLCALFGQAALAATDILGYEPLIWMTFDDGALTNQGSKAITLTAEGTANYPAAARPLVPDSKAVNVGSAGIRSYVPTSAALGIPIEGFTLSLYATLGTKSWGDVISFSPGSSGEGWRLERRSSNGAYAFYAIGDGTSFDGTAPSGDTTYHLYTFVVGTDRKVTVYLDGKVASTGMLASSMSVVNHFQFGKLFGGSHVPDNATIDDFRIYGRALTATEINILYDGLRTSYRWNGGEGSVEEPGDWSVVENWEMPPGKTAAPQDKNSSGDDPYKPILIANAVLEAPDAFTFEGWAVGMALYNAQVTINTMNKLQSEENTMDWIRVDETSSLTLRAGEGSLATGANIRQGFDVKPPQGVVFESVVNVSNVKAASYVLHDRGSVAFNGGISGVGLDHTLSFTIPVMDAAAPLRKVSAPRTLVSWAETTALANQSIAAGTITLANGGAVSASAVNLTQSPSASDLAVFPVGSYTLYKDATGIHVVYVEPVESITYTASLPADAPQVLWSEMPWDNSAVWQNYEDNLAEISGVVPEQELVLDQSVEAGRVAFAGTGPVVVSATQGGALNGALDLSAIAEGGAVISAPLDAFPLLPPAGVSKLTGANTFSGIATHASGTLELPANLGSATGLRLLGGHLLAGEGIIDTSLSLEVAQNATFTMPENLTWLGAITGSGTLTKAGSGALTFASQKTPGAVRVAEGVLLLNAADGGTAGLLKPDGAVAVAPGALLTLAGLNAAGSTATGTITLENGSAEQAAVLRVETGAQVNLRRQIYFGANSIVEIGEGGALTLDNTTIYTKTDPQKGTFRKAPGTVTDPVIKLNGTVTAYAGDAAQWASSITIPLKLEKLTESSGSFKKTGVGNVHLSYGTPGGDASVIQTLTLSAGTLVLAQGAIIADSFVGEGYTALTVTPQRNLTKACLTAGSFSFGNTCRIELSTNVANLPPSRYTLVKWTGQTAPALPTQLPNNMFINGNTGNGRVPGWELVRDLDRKAIILRSTAPGLCITLY